MQNVKIHKFKNVKLHKLNLKLQVQTKLKKIQITTFYQNPKSTVYCQNAKKSTQAVKEKRTGQRYQKEKSTKAVKRKDKICRGNLLNKQDTFFSSFPNKWPLSELKVQYKTY